MNERASSEELLGSYGFLLEISGIAGETRCTIGGFRSVSGMESETEIVEFKQGKHRGLREEPGRTTFTHIVLEKSLCAKDDLFLWRKNIEDGIIDRRSGRITARDPETRTTVAQYNSYEAWPCKWEIPKTRSNASMMAVDRLEIAVEKVERVRPE